MTLDYTIAKLPPYSLLDEPELSFDPCGKNTDVNPLRGLSEYGPYSSSVFQTHTPILRLATMAPRSGVEPLRDLVNSVWRKTHQSVEFYA